MNKLKIILANNTNLLFKESIKSIKDNLNDISKENIIIVPDALSLITEQEIFNLLNIDVYFNLSVMGISKFVNLILSDSGLKVLQASNLESKLLTLRAIQNTASSFKCFSKNYTLGFVDEIYAKIEQIKSSNINIDELIDENASIGTKAKFEDIKKIYKEYETLRGEKLDSGSLLTVFNNTASESDYLKNANVYFIGFDSMTKQGLQVLKNTVKNANYCQVSVTAPKNQENFRIYDTSFYKNIEDMAKENSLDYDVLWLNLAYDNKDKNQILNNLFSRKNKFDTKNEYFNIIKTNSVYEEVDLCVKYINFYLKTKVLNFKDFAICVDSSMHKILQTKLNSLGIDVYCDNKTNLFNLEPIKAIFSLIKYLQTKQSKHLINFILNDFIELNLELKYKLVNLLKQYSSLNNIKEFVKLEEQDLITFIDFVLSLNIEDNKDINYYLGFVENLFTKLNIFEKINKKTETFLQMGQIQLQKVYIQIKEKTEQIIECLKECLINQNLTIDEFVKLFETILTSTEIASVPSSTNQVFVGDLKSFYNEPKYLFILGMNEGVMPIFLNDYGLISDSEIESASLKAKLEPTTKTINKRNKFKLFETLLCATSKVFLSYHNFDADNKLLQVNDFISELKFLFNNKEFNIQDFNLTSESSLNLNKVLFDVVDDYNANLLINSNLNKSYKGLINYALAELNKTYLKPIPVSKDINFNKLFFKNNSASISVIEKYNSCPHSAFLSNALKLQPLKKDKIQANTIGTFIHEIGEKFVKFNAKKLGSLTKEEIKEKVLKIAEEILKNEEYYSLVLKENKFILQELKKEAVRFCEFLNYEQTLSAFKPKYLEKKFGGTSDFKSLEIKVDNNLYEIIGYVDRIDICENAFRVIDYKTGSQTNESGAKHLYYGTKIQLFVYSKAISENLKAKQNDFKLFGAFYLPIKNGFSKYGQNDYTLSGFYEDDPYFVIQCDNTLNLGNRKSKLINASFNKPKKGEITVKKANHILTESQLNSYCDYGVEIVKQSIKDINDGYIACSPIDKKCKRCEFSQICKFAENKKIERSEKFEISKQTFLDILNQD